MEDFIDNWVLQLEDANLKIRLYLESVNPICTFFQNIPFHGYWEGTQFQQLMLLHIQYFTNLHVANCGSPAKAQKYYEDNLIGIFHLSD